MLLEDRFFILCVVYIETVNNYFYIILIFSIKGGVDPTDTWPPNVGNSWRTTTDIQNYWSAVISNIDFVRLCIIISNLIVFALF